MWGMRVNAVDEGKTDFYEENWEYQNSSKLGHGILPRKEYLADPLYELAICANLIHLGGQYCSTLLGTFGVVRTLLQDVSMPWKE